MSDSPQSAIDEIFKISSTLKELCSKVDVLEKNIKSLNSKFIILTKKVSAIESLSVERPSIEEKKAPSASAPKSSSSESYETNNKLVLGSVKTYGYIVDTSRAPIVGVSISIFDDGNLKIRDIQTDKDGYWEARLPSGSYSVVYSHKKFNEIKKDIKIKEGSNSFRVD